VDAGEILVWTVWLAATAALFASGLGVVLFTNPFFSALSLIGNLASLAVLYLLLSAEFVAAAQVLVYAGAVVVMFLFVIAYLGGRATAPWRGGPPFFQAAAVIASVAIVTAVVIAIVEATGNGLNDAPEISDAFGSPASIGELFLSDHLLAFEATSIILLVAAVGGVILGSTVPPHKRDLGGDQA
jgi:NADH-quinone oxidoreductase subunit J